MPEIAKGGVLLERVGVLRNFAKLTGKHLYQNLFFNKVAGQPFLQSTSGELLLKCLKRKKANENDEQSYFSKKLIV